VFIELVADGYVASAAWAVSGDGTHVAGQATLTGGYIDAIRWTNEDDEPLGTDVGTDISTDERRSSATRHKMASAWAVARSSTAFSPSFAFVAACRKS
jgi:hypothetical protein